MTFNNKKKKILVLITCHFFFYCYKLEYDHIMIYYNKSVNLSNDNKYFNLLLIINELIFFSKYSPSNYM